MENLLIRVYKKRGLTRALSLTSHIISVIFVLAFLFCVSVMIYAEEYRVALLFTSSSLAGYLLVSAAREVLDAPRPYEIYDFFEILPKKKKGKSFPSRHAYSAFVITTISFAVGTLIGIALTVLALIMCVCRALVGIHFVRDLVAGAALGIISGSVALLLI